MRMANLYARFEARLRGVAMAFFMLSLILRDFVGWGSCVSYLQVAAGAIACAFISEAYIGCVAFACQPAVMS